ncbi:hypothetical protein BDZ89DRAFT_1150829 [Hymenopellis radicata]|nr:hypothetical protein BDZ89DRAFT_1150829 [Hymenopellis radicata]
MVFQGPSINVTRHVSGFVDSQNDSDLVLISDDLSMEEEAIIWGHMEPVKNDKDCDHLHFIWPPENLMEELMKQVWPKTGGADFAGIWSFTCDRIFRHIWKELLVEQHHEAVSQTPGQFGALFFYRNSDDHQHYAPRHSNIMCGVNIVTDGWVSSWKKIKLSSLDLPVELCE